MAWYNRGLVEDARTWSVTVPRPKMLATFPVQPAAWAAACLVATVAVGVLQIQHRAPLAWDEATRVLPGQEFVFALRSGNPGAVWTWLNEQTFYPFVAPLLHGLVLLGTNDPLMAAWLPALAAYAGLGLLAAALAHELRLGRLTAWVAAILCWTTPLYARLASGGFVDTLGACASLGTLILALRAVRTGRLRDGLLTGLIASLAALIRYDFGLLLLASLAIGIPIMVLRSRPRPRRWKTLLAGGALFGLLVGLWFVPNMSAKWAGFGAFSGAGHSLGELSHLSLDQWTFYVTALWYSDELGLSALVADVVLVACLYGALAAWRNARLVPLLVSIAVWYGFFSAAGSRSPQYARYMAAVLPLAFVFAGLLASDLLAWLQRAVANQRLARRVRQVAVLACAFELARQVLGPTGFAQQFWFVSPNPPADDVARFVSRSLRATPGSSLLFVGDSNEISPYLVQLEWMRAVGHPGQHVTTLVWLPPDLQGGSLYDAVRHEHIDLVLALRVGTGSRFDTPDFRAGLASRSHYEQALQELAASSHFRRMAALATDEGRIEVALWRVD